MFFIESSGQIFHYYKLQTCHPSQHLEKASEKKSARGTTKKSAYTNWDCNKPLLFPFFRWVHPWLAVPLIFIVIIKSFSASSLATRVFFSQKTVSSSGNPPPTHSWMRVLSQPVAQTVGGSLFCAASHWGNQTQSYSSHQPLVAKKQERFLPLSLCFYFSHCWFPLPFGHLAHTPCIRIHTQSNQPSLKAVLVCTLRCSAGC